MDQTKTITSIKSLKYSDKNPIRFMITNNLTQMMSTNRIYDSDEDDEDDEYLH